MEKSFSQRLIHYQKPFILYHTYSVTAESVSQAISENKSMDLDISVDEAGQPYIGHSQEFYAISGEVQLDCLPLWEAVERIEKSSIPVIVDCKHHQAWSIVKEVIQKIGPHRCLLHTAATELKFDFNFYDHDYPTEWSGINKLKSFKATFPNITTTASCKFLPEDFLTSENYLLVWKKIRAILVENNVDTVCLNIPNGIITNEVIDFFYTAGILVHVNVDRGETRELTGLYVGETNQMNVASKAELLGY